MANFQPFITDFGKTKKKASPGYLTDPVVSNPKKLLGNILQDPGVKGQVAGDRSLIPSGYTDASGVHDLYVPPGNLASGTTVNYGEWANQGWPKASTVPGYNPDPTEGAGWPVDTSGNGAATGGKTWRPGYISTIFDDPMYQAALNRYNTNLGLGRTTLRDQIQQAIIRSGYIPTMSQELAQYADDLDNPTITAAQGNQMSQKAILDRQLAQNQTNLDYALAGRGSGSNLFGGAHQIGADALTDQHNAAAYQQMGSLIDALQGYGRDWVGTQTGEGDKLQGVLTDVASRLASTPGPTYDDLTADPAAVGLMGQLPYSLLPNERTDVTGTQGPVTWGGRQFLTKDALTQYLNSIPGITSAQFAAAHPSAWGRLA